MRVADLPLSDELAALPAPWGQIMRALEALNSLGDTRHALLEAQIAQLHAELGEIRDEMVRPLRGTVLARLCRNTDCRYAPHAHRHVPEGVLWV